MRERDPRFLDQLLAGGLSPLEIFAGLIAAGVVFFGGLLFWGGRFKNTRRTTILFYGIVGGAVLVLAGLAFNHSGGLSLPFRAPFALVAGGGLFLLAGATPAALGLLADMSEAYPGRPRRRDGPVFGLSRLGQILGSLVGGFAAERAAIDGLLVATLVMMGIALCRCSGYVATSTSSRRSLRPVEEWPPARAGFRAWCGSDGYLPPRPPRSPG